MSRSRDTSRERTNMLLLSRLVSRTRNISSRSRSRSRCLDVSASRHGRDIGKMNSANAGGGGGGGWSRIYSNMPNILNTWTNSVHIINFSLGFFLVSRAVMSRPRSRSQKVCVSVSISIGQVSVSEKEVSDTTPTVLFRTTTWCHRKPHLSSLLRHGKLPSSSQMFLYNIFLLL